MADTLHGDTLTETDLSNGESNMVLDVSSPHHDHSNRPLYYYVDVPNAHKSTYEACERNVGIDPAFHAQLQQENEHDISIFIALPKIIPVRKGKRQHPLLDFTRSKFFNISSIH